LPQKNYLLHKINLIKHRFGKNWNILALILVILIPLISVAISWQLIKSQERSHFEVELRFKNFFFKRGLHKVIFEGIYDKAVNKIVNGADPLANMTVANEINFEGLRELLVSTHFRKLSRARSSVLGNTFLIDPTMTEHVEDFVKFIRLLRELHSSKVLSYLGSNDSAKMQLTIFADAGKVVDLKPTIVVLNPKKFSGLTVFLIIFSTFIVSLTVSLAFLSFSQATRVQPD
tara:strand:- start:5810 stop:6502 length:693 start_codon:yes stop_codon:yes gene_type:complete